MLFDDETLAMLRKNTKLGPIAKHRISSEKDEAQLCQKEMNKLENCQLEADYRRAKLLEAELRFRVWKDKIITEWLNNHSYEDLDEYALERLIEENMKKEASKTFRRKR